MNEHIKSAVDAQSELSLKLNKGEHHRIMKTGWHGSIWISKTASRGYRIETTGSVGNILNPKIINLLGRVNDEENAKGYKVWFVENNSDIEKVISLCGKL